MVNMTIRHGNCDASGHGVWLSGHEPGPILRRLPAGLQFGRLGYDLVAKRQWWPTRPKSNTSSKHSSASGTSLGALAIEHLIPPSRPRSLRRDLNTAGYVCDHWVSHKLAAGEPLDKLYVESEAFRTLPARPIRSLLSDHHSDPAIHPGNAGLHGRRLDRRQLRFRATMNMSGSWSAMNGRVLCADITS